MLAKHAKDEMLQAGIMQPLDFAKRPMLHLQMGLKNHMTLIMAVVQTSHSAIW